MWVALSFNFRYWFIILDHVRKDKNEIAIIHNEYEYLIYSHTNGAKLTKNMCTTAASYGSLECLQYLCEQLYLPLSSDSENTPNLCYSAAEYGHLECLKYAHKNGFALTNKVCEIAARNGKKECLQYACENCINPNIDNVATITINANRIDCLKYVISVGAVIDQTRIHLSFITHTFDMIEFVCSQTKVDFTHPKYQYFCSSAILWAPNLKYLRFAVEQGAPLSRTYYDKSVYDHVIKGGNYLPCLRYCMLMGADTSFHMNALFIKAKWRYAVLQIKENRRKRQALQMLLVLKRTPYLNTHDQHTLGNLLIPYL
jgi:hypothetical protein